MKRIISAIMLVLLCTALFACNRVTHSTASTNNTAANTSASTVTPPADASSQPALRPEKPEKLTEKTAYDYSSLGFSVIKYYIDENGNSIEEHIYTIDKTLGILHPYVLTFNNYGENGKLTSSSAKYSSHPINAEPTKNLFICADEENRYDYKTINENGKALLYINETENKAEGTVTTEYFTRGGKLTMREITVLHPNGERMKTEIFDGNGSRTFLGKYNDRGNIVSAELVTESEFTQVNFEYGTDGKLKKYLLKTTSLKNGYTTHSIIVKFDENGNVSDYGGIKPVYDENGMPESVSAGIKTYVFDKAGYVTQCTNTGNNAVITYEYDAEGRLTLEKSTGNTPYENKYTYAADGSCALEMYGTGGRKTYFILTDKSGNVTVREKYSGSSVSSAEHYTFGEYGELLKTEVYKHGTLESSEAYTYNENGDVTSHESTDHIRRETLRKTYEYFDNGKLKLYVSYDANGLKKEMLEYFEDGSCRTTNYDTEAGTYVMFLLSADGLLLEAESTAEGYYQKSAYTYYESGKLFSFYHEKEGFVSCVYYLENGNIAETYEKEEGKQGITTKYVRINGEKPIRLDIYEGKTLVARTMLEYKSYVNDQNCVMKSAVTYDMEDNVLLRCEYAEKAGTNAPESVLIKKEQFEYENGNVVYHSVTEYDLKSGSAIIQKETRGEIYIETEYEYKSSQLMGLMLKRTTYKNGKIVSAMEITQAAVPPVYEEKFYDESGRITHSYIYRSHTDELVPEYTTEYVYGENGKLASTSMYYHAGALKLLTIYEEYGENGHSVKKEVFSYDVNFEEGEYTLKDRTVNFYDENGSLIKAIYYIGETIYKEEMFTYNENGKIIKKIRHDYADGEICSSYETHIDELGRYTYYSEKHNNGASHEEITEYRGDRVVKNEIYHNGELYQRILLEFNEKDLLVRHLEQYTNSKKETIYKYNSADLESEIALYVNDKLTERTVFEYHKNGMRSSIIKYDANGNATSKTYFDTNGSVIETC